VFADHFSTGQVSSRWFFNGDWEVKDGILQRERSKSKTTRIFARGLEYRDALIRFDFQLRQSQDVRLVTGSKGAYNLVLHIHPDHFQIETGKDDSGPYFQHWHGDCAYDFTPNRWYTMTVELLGDQAVAHIDHDHIVYAQHAILNKTRSYFAFQVDDAPAALDNVQIFTAAKHRQLADNLRHIASVAGKHPVQRSLENELHIAQTNAHDRLYQTDERYRALVKRVHELDEQNKKLFPTVFRSHKEIRHDLGAMRRKLHEEDSRYKELLFATHRAARALDMFLIEQQPEVADLPDSRRKREIERLRTKFQHDARYLTLLKQHESAQAQLEDAYPQLFVSDQQITDARRKRRDELRNDPAFRQAIARRADAWRAQRDYLTTHDKRILELQRQTHAATDEPSMP